MISFSPTEEQKLMIDSASEFARRTLRPRMRAFEQARSLPEDIRKAAHELGFSLAALPEEVGGAGLGFTTAVLLEEEIAWGDPASAFGFAGPGALGLAVVELGTASQARDALTPFVGAEGYTRFGAVAWGEKKAHPARPGFSTSATKEGSTFRLTGEKAYVINADRADRFVVFAQVDEASGWDGVGAFLVDRGAPGLHVLPRSATLGLDVASFGGLRLDDVTVPETAHLTGGSDFTASTFTASLVRFFAKNALLVAARSVGLSRAAFEATREYVDTRKAFGKAIGHFQAVAFTVADRAIDVEAARGLVWRAAASWDALAKKEAGVDERQCLLETAQAVSYAHEAAMRCGDDAVQLHGGAGFMRDYAVEKLMRDAKQLGLCGLTAEHADQLAAAIELGLPLHPGLVLPTPETQNAFV